MADSERCGWFMQLSPEISACALTSSRKSFVCINIRLATVPFRNTATIHLNNINSIYYVRIRNGKRLLRVPHMIRLHTEAATIKIFVCKQKSNGGRQRCVYFEAQNIFFMPYFSILSTHNERGEQVDQYCIYNHEHMENWQKCIAMRQILVAKTNLPKAIFLASRWVRTSWPSSIHYHCHQDNKISNCIFIVAATSFTIPCAVRNDVSPMSTYSNIKTDTQARESSSK